MNNAKYIYVGLAPINTNLDNAPGVAYYDRDSKFFNISLAENGLDVSFEGLPRPIPPSPDEDEDDSEAHIVDPNSDDFLIFLEKYKAYFIAGLIIFIVIVVVMAVVFYIYDRKKRKGIYTKVSKKSKAGRTKSYDTDGDRLSELDDSL